MEFRLEPKFFYDEAKPGSSLNSMLFLHGFKVSPQTTRVNSSMRTDYLTVSLSVLMMGAGSGGGGGMLIMGMSLSDLDASKLRARARRAAMRASLRWKAPAAICAR